MFSFSDQSELKLLLKEYLETNGIKQRWLSKKIGIDETRISHFLHGRENLTDKHYNRLIRFLLVTK